MVNGSAPVAVIVYWEPFPAPKSRIVFHIKAEIELMEKSLKCAKNPQTNCFSGLSIGKLMAGLKKVLKN